MDILHLTDLHVTEPNTTLNGVWSTAYDQLRAARRESFDFIVVSGDLTQQAGAREYEALATFAADHLVPRLRKPAERRRIVFVPGNHDVQWGDTAGTAPGRVRQIFERVTGWKRPTDAELRDYSKHPHLSPLRQQITRGKVRYKRRTPDYGHRFARVQSFLDTFYAGGTGPSDQAFALTHPAARHHWSAHVFHRDKVAFFGFNSCFYNDELWRGATLEEDAITAATAHGREHAAGYLWVAVWHHGLATDRGSPDYLTTRDLGRLRFNGFHVGIHGHTHVDEFSDINDVLGDRFPIVATGSFAAGPPERPEGTLNQFAVLELGPSYLCIERFERLPTTQWRRRSLPPYALRAGLQDEPVNDADRHERVFRIDTTTGFTDVEIRFVGIEVRRDLVLAAPIGPYSNMVAYKATNGTSVVDVFESEGPDGNKRLQLGQRGSFPDLRWSCRLSNILARDRADLVMSTSHGPAPEAADDFDWVSHDVTLHTRELVLAIETMDPAQTLFSTDAGESGVRVVDASGRDVGSETSRAAIQVTPTRLSVTIERPVVGHRYTLRYRPTLSGLLCPVATFILITNASTALRRGLAGDAMRKDMADGIGAGLRIALDSTATDLTRIVWYGYLWNAERHRLETAFGNYPWSAAGSEFEYGRGVVGHAFRFATPTSYFATEGATSLVLTGKTTFDWIVAIPILLTEQGPAVGVIGFAGRDEAGWDRELRNYAKELAQRRQLFTRTTASQRAASADLAATDRLAAFEQRLVQTAALLFWNELRHVIPELGDADRAEFQRIFGYWAARVREVAPPAS